MKAVYLSAALTGGVALLFALMPDLFFGNYISMMEQSMFQQAAQAGYIPQDMVMPILNNLEEMRRAVFVADAWRSVIIVAIGLLLLVAFYLKKMNATVVTAGLIVLCLTDMWQVNKRYLNDAMFTEPLQNMKETVKTPADDFILQDKSLDYRVLNLASNTFNESNTSFFHKSIGGYHPAKLRRYQEVIEEHIVPEMSTFGATVAQCGGRLDSINGDSLFPVLNMLNVKYAILPLQDGKTAPVLNPHANGNGWFVCNVKYVNNADEEIMALHNTPLKKVAVVDKKFQDILGSETSVAETAAGVVQITQYDANKLTYEVNSPKGGVVVFSENYYPGWTATIDGNPVEIARANYILRAIKVPAGKHTVVFSFDPVSVHVTEGIAYGALILLLLGVLFLVWKDRKAIFNLN